MEVFLPRQRTCPRLYTEPLETENDFGAQEHVLFSQGFVFKVISQDFSLPLCKTLIVGGL